MTIFTWIGWLLWIPVGITGLYLLTFALASYRRAAHRGPKVRPGASPKARIALLVPAYREDGVIIDTARRLRPMDYPQALWDLVIIGDHLQPETLAQLRSMPLRLVELALTDSTKAKALNAALAQLGDDYDLAVVLDADNVVDPDFLRDLDAAWQQGGRAMQARRVAKNEQTPTALLDAISEEVNNSIFCQAHRNLGLSSRLIGSGMAFDYALFKRLMAENQAVGGFDKELELTLMGSGEVIEYLPDTWVYDEKVSQTAHFKRQRLRWIAAQYHYLRRYWRAALQKLLRGEQMSFVDKTFQHLLLPRLVLVGGAGLGALLALLLAGPALQWAWGLAFGWVALAYALATPRRFYRWHTLGALLRLPGIILHMVWELRGVGKANRKFIHTPHGEVGS